MISSVSVGYHTARENSRELRGLNISRDFLIMIAHMLGVEGDLSDWEDAAIRYAIREAFKLVVWNEGRAKYISNAMRHKGVTVKKVGLDEVIKDILFRVWKVVFCFGQDFSVPGSGYIANRMRDSQLKKINVMVKAEGVKDDTHLFDIVMVVMKCVYELTF